MSACNNWLKPQPDQIDKNFEDFLNYFKDKPKYDNLYTSTIDLLDERVDIMLDVRKRTANYELIKIEEENVIFNVRLLAAWLLAVNNQEKRQAVLLAFINNIITLALLQKSDLKRYAPKNLFTFYNIFYDAVECELPQDVGLTWDDICTSNMDTVALKFVEAVTHHQKEMNPLTLRYENKGCLLVDNGKIKLVSTNYETYEKAKQMGKTAEFLLANDSRFGIVCKKGEALKESSRDDAKAVGDYVNGMLVDMQAVKATASESKKKKYVNDDLAPVEIVSVRNGVIRVKTLDPQYEEVQGELCFQGNLFLMKKIYKWENWEWLLTEGVKLNAYYGDGKFYFVDLLQDYLEDTFTSVVESGEPVVASFKKMDNWNPVDGKMMNYPVWTKEGYCVNVDFDVEEYDRFNDMEIMEIRLTEFDKNEDYYGEIHGELVKVCDFNIVIVPSNVCPKYLEGFLKSEEHDLAFAPEEKKVAAMDEGVAKEICCALMQVQSREENALPRFKMLCMARLLACMSQLEQDSEWLNYFSKYLQNLIQFASANEPSDYDDIKVVETPAALEGEESITRCKDVMRVLECFGDDYDKSSEVLDPIIDGADEWLSRVASMVQTYNRLNGSFDAKILKSVKREVLNSLSVVAQGDSELDLATELMGVFGDEDSSKEFKSSFFEAPKSAEEQRQEMNVLRGVCAMMNAHGGTLYLGVNDFGQPIGLENDLKHLEKNGYRADIDGLMLYISRKGEEKFGETIWRCVSLKYLNEYGVIAFHIEPYPYDVVKLEDKAYLRKNNGSAPIRDEKTMADIRARRRENLLKVNDKIILLKDAVDRGVQVKIMKYQSSSSNTVSDRVVEPYAFDGDEYVTCYEVSTDSCKSFRISRMAGVKVLKEPQSHKSEHKAMHVDKFHMHGDMQYDLRLKMTMRARNAIIEQYPALESDIFPADNIWNLNVKVHSMRPIAHFYLSYAADIEIVSAEGMMEIVKSEIDAIKKKHQL